MYDCIINNGSSRSCEKGSHGCNIRHTQPKKTLDQVKAIVDKVQFMDRRFLVLVKDDGFLLQMEYYEPDVDKPGSAPVRQSTRKYYLSPFMTETEIVETCWLCVQRSQLHVASEHFTYVGRRVYSQHFSIEGRILLCDTNDYDGRLPLKK
jgi:hypothetical protein